MLDKLTCYRLYYSFSELEVLEFWVNISIQELLISPLDKRYNRLNRPIILQHLKHIVQDVHPHGMP